MRKLRAIWEILCGNGVIYRCHISCDNDWDRLGSKAGPLRNFEMAKHADALLLIWDGKSRGSKSMLHIALGVGLVVAEVVR